MKTNVLLLRCLVYLALANCTAGQSLTNAVLPGDPITLVNGVNDGDSFSGPPPGVETVDHAIDRVTQKYLNFLDLGSGFVVTPSAGPSIVIALRFYTANDSEERDPASFSLEGSTSGPGGPWTSIASGGLALPSGRNIGGGIPINPATHFNQLVTFPNANAFTSYRVTFPTLKNASLANSMQIGEVELLRSLATAGELFVNVDATAEVFGTLAWIPNSGTLGGFFEARAGGSTVPIIALAGGTKGIQFAGFDYLQLVASQGGPLIRAPAGLVGADPTRSIEVWVFNPDVGIEEPMISWGQRGGGPGSNMSFNYGTSSESGAAGHWGNPGLGWNDIGGAPPAGRWHHLVYTYDGTTTRVYTNGVLANMEVLGPGVINTHPGTAINLATQLEADGVTPTFALRGTLTIGRVRVHDGVLTDAQVQENFRLERDLFIDEPPFPAQALTSSPIHRYSFNEAATPTAEGLTFRDSIGAAHGTVRGVGATFTSTRLTLPGGSSATAAYGDLPNGLLSSHGTNNGGPGEISIEGWVKHTGFRGNSRFFDFGSTTGGEVLGPGGGGSGLDYLMYSADFGSVDNHRLELFNEDPAGGGTLGADVVTRTFNTDLHFVVTWRESTGEIKIYENGNHALTVPTDDRISDINDVNVWLGRSNWSGDPNFQGEFDEFRIYRHVLTPGEVLGNFQAGPDTITASPPSPYAAAVLADGPIAYWRFNDVKPVAINSGSLGATVNGTYNGDANAGVQAPRPPTFSGFESNNTALQLDGAGDFVRIMSSLMNSRPVFTISGWIRRNGPQISRTGLWGQNDLVEFGYIDNNTIQAWTDSGLDVTPNPIPDAQWAHLAMVSAGSPGTMRIYTNGLLAASRPHIMPGDNGFLFNIGGGGVFDDGAFNGNFFNGQIDEVAVFDRELSTEQIALQYSSAVPLIILQQPSGATVCAGTAVPFTVALNSPADIQWQMRSLGGAFANISGATNATYVTLPVTAFDDGTRFRAQLSRFDTNLTSAEAVLSVVAITTPTVTYDFNSGLPAGTALYGSAFIDTGSGVLELNPNAASQSGTFLTADLVPGRAVNGFTTTFKLRIVPGNLTADGFSLNWGTDLPFGPFAFAEEGEGTGLSVCFDTWDNGGGEAPAIDVKWGGAVIAHSPVAPNFLVTGDFVDVQIRLNTDATLDVMYNCTPINTRLPIPGFTPLSGARFGLASRTGGAWETHAIDDLALQLSLDPIIGVARITSVASQLPTGLAITGVGTPGANVALEASTDFVNWSWRANVSPDASGIFVFVEADAATLPYRFYRLASAPQLPSGLVTWWRAENNYRDSFGPNHGSDFGVGPTFTGGQRGQSFSFNGATEAMYIGGAPIPVPWTACFWVRRQDATEASAALLTDPSVALKLEQWPSLRQVGFTVFGVADYNFNYIAPANTWTHLTFVGTPSGISLFANGVFVETHPAIIHLPMNILGVRENNFDHLQGQLDDITLFNRALSPAEIQQVLNSTRGP